MELHEVITLGRNLLTEFGLEDWRFDISLEKQTLGRCEYDKKTIYYSIHYLKASDYEIEDTIRHEIAHALVGAGHGHDDVWKRMCLRVGAAPKRCAPVHVKSSAKPNYYVECSSCQKRWPRYRLKGDWVNAKSVCCHARFKLYKVVK